MRWILKRLLQSFVSQTSLLYSINDHDLSSAVQANTGVISGTHGTLTASVSLSPYYLLRYATHAQIWIEVDVIIRSETKIRDDHPFSQTTSVYPKLLN